MPDTKKDSALLVGEIQGPQTVQAITTAVGCLPKIDKTLLLKDTTCFGHRR